MTRQIPKHKNDNRSDGDSDLEKLVRYSLTETVVYKEKEVHSRVIFKRITGSISAFSFDNEAQLDGKYSPFDTFIYVIEGGCLLTTKEKEHTLKAGDAMIIPANTHHHYKASTKLKVLFTIIKSGYEEIVV